MSGSDFALPWCRILCKDAPLCQIVYDIINSTSMGDWFPDLVAMRKAAANEITAINAILRSGVNQFLDPPLRAVHLVCGHCVIAEHEAPDDAIEQHLYGLPVQYHPLVPTARDLARSLGLAEHRVIDGAGGTLRLWMPADSSIMSIIYQTTSAPKPVNRIATSRLSRLMPAVPPPPGDPLNCHLFQRFRPEFLALHPQLSLSPDAFSPFGVDPADEAKGP